MVDTRELPDDPQRPSIAEIIERQDELADAFEAYEPGPDDEVEHAPGARG
ncbi:MAG: hypothetical protein ACR2J5_09180 [Geodermatophilaceae bacterium]